MVLETPAGPDLVEVMLHEVLRLLDFGQSLYVLRLASR